MMMVHSLRMLAAGLSSGLRAVFGHGYWFRVALVVVLSSEHGLLLLGILR